MNARAMGATSIPTAEINDDHHREKTRNPAERDQRGLQQGRAYLVAPPSPHSFDARQVTAFLGHRATLHPHGD